MDENYDFRNYQSASTFDEELYNSINEYDEPNHFIDLLANNSEITCNQPISSDFVKYMVFTIVMSNDEDKVTELINFFESEGQSDPQKQLIVALLKGNIKEVELLLKNGVSLEGGEWKGEYIPAIWSIILFSTTYNIKNMLTLLIQYGLDTSIKNEQDQNLLHGLCSNFQYGNFNNALEVARALYNSGVPIDEVDNSGLSPLQYAVQENLDYDLVEFFVNNGANVNRRDNNGNSLPLTSSMLPYYDEDVTKLLLSSGADVNAKENYSGRTALHHACLSALKNKIIILLENGADMSTIDNNGDTPCALLHPFSRGYNECQLAMIKEIAKVFFENVHNGLCESQNDNLIKLLAVITFKDIELNMGRNETAKHVVKCLKEMGLVRRAIFYHPYSYYHVLSSYKNVKKLAKLSRNKKFVTKFKESLDSFSYYREDLIKEFNYIIRIGKDSELVYSRLTSVFKQVLPDVVIRIVAENLTAKDLPLL